MTKTGTITAPLLSEIRSHPGESKTHWIEKFHIKKTNGLQLFDRLERHGRIWIQRKPNGHFVFPVIDEETNPEILKNLSHTLHDPKDFDAIFNPFRNKKLTPSTRKTILELAEMHIFVRLTDTSELHLLKIVPAFGIKTSRAATKKLNHERAVIARIFVLIEKIDPKLKTELIDMLYADLTARLKS